MQRAKVPGGMAVLGKLMQRTSWLNCSSDVGILCPVR